MRCTSEMAHSLCNLVPSLINLSLFFFLFRFETTDTYPLDSNKYPVSRFDPLLMEKHNAWKAAGGTELNWDTLNDHDINFTTPLNATQPLQSEVTNSPKEKLNKFKCYCVCFFTNNINFIPATRRSGEFH